MKTALGAVMPKKYLSYEEIVTKKKVRDAIKRRVGRNAHGSGGTMPCVACEYGSIRYHVHRTGQINAACSTNGCVSWEEKPGFQR